jgi:hypothetical protein
MDDNTKHKGKVITQPENNVFVTNEPDDNTKCLRQTVLSPNQMIQSIFSSSQMTTQNVIKTHHQPGDNIYVTSSQMITPNMQACAIIQPDDKINVIIWPGDNIATVI